MERRNDMPHLFQGTRNVSAPSVLWRPRRVEISDSRERKWSEGNEGDTKYEKAMKLDEETV